MVDAGQQGGVPADVVALLAHRGRRAHHHVVGLAEVDLRISLDQRAQRERGQLVGPDGLERALAGSPDRGTDGVDDHGFRHALGILDALGRRPRWHPSVDRAPGGYLPSMASTEQGTRYREIKRLGAGGMATVTLAEDTVLGRSVALKRVYRTGDHRDMLRLKREAMVGASLNHPNLVFVYDVQLQDDGDVVIIMEYVEGETLADVIESRGALTASEAIRVLRGVGAALDAIHERGIVHRDVKPANVLLGRDGTVKLADLGVADVPDRTRIT